MTVLSRYFRPLIAAAGLLGLCASPQDAVAAQTRSFVVGWFGQATYSQDNDCPGGLNPEIGRQYDRDLAALGFTKKEIAEMGKKRPDGTTAPSLREVMDTRGRIDGKPVNPYSHPDAVADPHLKAMTGKYAYGFNLDGKGAEAPNAFEDPETHEQGVDDQLARALGCMHAFRGSLSGRPTYWAWAWGQLKDSEPAWVITLTAQDFSKDGDVTIVIDRALEHLRSNIDGSPKADVTYRIDPDPRSHNVLHGQIRGGVISLPQPAQLHMLQNPLVAPELRLSSLHMRLALKPDGTIAGILGGYQPWADLYFSFAAGGPGMEVCITGDIPGIYYLLKHHADADPDPKTGQNAAISAAYYLEAVPAFVVAADAQKAAR